jgi:hypothetical protein
MRPQLHTIPDTVHGSTCNGLTVISTVQSKPSYNWKNSLSRDVLSAIILYRALGLRELNGIKQPGGRFTAGNGRIGQGTYETCKLFFLCSEDAMNFGRTQGSLTGDYSHVVKAEAPDEIAVPQPIAGEGPAVRVEAGNLPQVEPLEIEPIIFP